MKLDKHHNLLIIIFFLNLNLIHCETIDNNIEIPIDKDISDFNDNIVNKNSKVIELNTDNINLFKSSKYSIVFFYLHNSDKNMIIEYNKASILSFEQNIPFKFFRVNILITQELDIDKEKTQSIKIYVNGNSKYYLGLNYSILINRYLHIILEGPIALFNNLNEIINFKKEYELNFIFGTTIKEDNPDYEIIKNFTEENIYYLNTIQCYSKECLNKLGEESVFVLNNYDEKVVKLEEKISMESLKLLLRNHSLEIGGELDIYSFQMISTLNISSVIYFRDTKNKEQREKDVLFKELGKKYKENYLFFKSDIKGNHFKESLGELFEIEQKNLPSVQIFDPQNYYNYKIKTKEISLDSVEEFITGVIEGKIERELNSEPIPENDLFSFNVIVGKTFNKIVLEANKPYLVLFYTNDISLCHECKNAGEIFQEISDKYIKEYNDKRFGMGVIDVLYNEIKREITSLPLISFYNIPGEKKPIDYKGKYKIKDLENFIVDKIGWSDIPLFLEQDLEKIDL